MALSLATLSSGQIFSLVVLLLCLYLGFKHIFRPQPNNPRQNGPAGRAEGAEGAGGGNAAPSTAKLTPVERFLTPNSNKQCVCISTGAITEGSEMTLRPENITVLRLLARHTRLHLVTQCTSLAVERQVNDMLEQSGLFEEGLARHRVLFCTKQAGKSAMIRHLEPALYVDDDLETLVGLLPHLPLVVHIAKQATGLPSSKAIVVPSLQDFFFIPSPPVSTSSSVSFSSPVSSSSSTSSLTNVSSESSSRVSVSSSSSSSASSSSSSASASSSSSFSADTSSTDSSSSPLPSSPPLPPSPSLSPSI